MKTRHSLTLTALVASISLLTGTVSAQDPSEDAELDIFSAEMAALQAVDLFDSLSETDFAGDGFANEQNFAPAQESSPVLTTARGQVVTREEAVFQSQPSERPVRIAQLEDRDLEADVPAAPPATAEVPRFSREPSDSNVRNSRMTAAELRQARALYRARQRTARLEYNLWMGYEPLRPNWNAVPMMTSRYSNRRIYVPMYVNPSR